MVKISTALILKNEGSTIYRALDSVKNFTDEYVIGIDTFTTDNTKAEVDRFFIDNKNVNKIVYDYEWRESFAEGRNEGMDKCTGDWIFILDGHEFIAGPWFNITENRIIDSQQTMLEVKKRLTKDGCVGNSEQSQDADDVFFCLYQQPFVDQTPNNFFMQPRLYRNGKSKLEGQHAGKPIRFGRAAHNTIKFSRPELSVHYPEVILIHDAPESNREERKIQRGAMNVKQLSDDIAINPKDTRAYFYLGNTYLETKDFKKAVDAYDKYREFQKHEHSEYYQALLNQALAYKELKDVKRSRSLLGLAMATDPTRRDAIVLLGDLAKDDKDFEKAVSFYNHALSLQAKPSRMFNNGGVYTWLPHQALSQCYKELGNKEMAISHLKICLNYANFDGWRKELAILSNDTKNILIVDSIGSFTKDFEEYLINRGYNVIKNKTLDPYLGMWADSIWCEWADRNAINIKDFASKTVIRVHGYEAYYNQSIFKDINWECKKVVFVADHIKEKMMSLVPSLNGQCTTIQNGVNTDKFFIKNTTRDKKNVGYAGFLNAKKNPMRLAAIIRANPDMIFNLRVDWQDNSLEEAFNFETKNLKNIIYHGFYDDLNEFWNQMSYVISTSDIESFSFNIAEGMSAGCEPVIYNWKGANKIWHKNYIFKDQPTFKKDIDMKANREYIKSNFSLTPSLQAMEQALIG